MMDRYTVQADQGSPYFDPREGCIIVAFTRGEHVSHEALIAELQRASDEGIVSGDFQLMQITDHENDGMTRVPGNLAAVVRAAGEGGSSRTVEQVRGAWRDARGPGELTS